jgi:hypothetical protein
MPAEGEELPGFRGPQVEEHLERDLAFFAGEGDEFFMQQIVREGHSSFLHPLFRALSQALQRGVTVTDEEKTKIQKQTPPKRKVTE